MFKSGDEDFLSLTFIIRDGSHTFRSEIYKTSPNNVQLANHFHLLNTLTDYAVKAPQAFKNQENRIGERKVPLNN